MTQQRSTDDIRTDIAVMDGCETWSERYHDSMIRVLHDVEPLLARAERAEAKVRAVEALAAEWYAEKGAADGYAVTAEGRSFAAASRLCADEVRAALAAGLSGLSLQEEQE